MSLPLLVIFDRHWDATPKNLLKNVLPKLSGEGYDTLCFEAPQNLSEEEIRTRANKECKESSDIYAQAQEFLRKRKIVATNLSDMDFGELRELMRQYVSSHHSDEVAKHIKNLPAVLVLGEIFKTAKHNSIFIEGIDIDQTDYDAMLFSGSEIEKTIKLQNFDPRRISTFVENLLKLRSKRGGVIFACGAFHAPELISHLKAKGIQDIVYYFPHSSKRNYKSFDCISELCANETLKGHAYNLDTDAEIASFTDRVLKEVKEKNTAYVEELKENSHISFLNDFFRLEFKAFKRPGYYVDALLMLDGALAVNSLVEKLQSVNVQTRTIVFQNNKSLVIPEVNTAEVAAKIRKLR